MIWNETKECMSRDEMTNLQSARLVKLVDRVYHNVEYYRKKMQAVGLEPGDIKGIEDLDKLPFTTIERNTSPMVRGPKVVLAMTTGTIILSLLTRLIITVTIWGRYPTCSITPPNDMAIQDRENVYIMLCIPPLRSSLSTSSTPVDSA